MANPTPSRKFEKGNTLAAENNNSKGKRIKKSPLRKTLAKLQSLEPYALALIEKSVKEQEVDRESLSTSKWLVSNLMTLTISVLESHFQFWTQFTASVHIYQINTYVVLIKEFLNNFNCCRHRPSFQISNSILKQKGAS